MPLSPPDRTQQHRLHPPLCADLRPNDTTPRRIPAPMVRIACLNFPPFVLPSIFKFILMLIFMLNLNNLFS